MRNHQHNEPENKIVAKIQWLHAANVMCVPTVEHCRITPIYTTSTLQNQSGMDGNYIQRAPFFQRGFHPVMSRCSKSSNTSLTSHPTTLTLLGRKARGTIQTRGDSSIADPVGAPHRQRSRTKAIYRVPKKKDSRTKIPQRESMRCVCVCVCKPSNNRQWTD